MAQRSKRKAKYELDTDDAEVKTKQTIKTTLYSILKEETREDFMFVLEPFLLQCNQLRVATSLAIKYHYLALLNGPYEEDLPFELNQYYFTYLFNTFRGSTRLKGHEDIEREDVRAIISEVEAALKWTFRMHPHLSDSLFSSQAAILGNEYVRIFQTHIKTHIETALKLWKKNQLIARFTDDEFDNHFRNRLAQVNKLKADDLSTYLGPPTFARYERLQQDIEAWMLTLTASDDEDELETKVSGKQKKEKKKKKKSELPPFFFERGLKLMWEMRRDSELLEEKLPLRKFKSISLLPQYETKINYIQLDSKIMLCFYNIENDQKAAPWEHQRIWSEYFDMNKLSKLKKAAIEQGKAAFEYTISTDGIGASVLFAVLKHRFPKRSTDIPAQKQALVRLHPGLYSEPWLLERYQGYDATKVGFMSGDPGVRNLVQWCKIQKESDASEFSHSMKQSEYRHHINNKFTRDTRENLRIRKIPLQQNVQATPFCRSSDSVKFMAYIKTLGQHWKETWNIAAEKKFRWGRFEAFKRSQRFMDRWVEASRQLAKGKIILMGNAANKSGGFGKVRGGGIKGPVKKFTKLLSRQTPVIIASEFRTSKCCFACARELLHPKGFIRKSKSSELVESKLNGISYCRETGHHMFLSRDKDAARKIGYRFLCRLVRGAGCDLGTWSHSVKWEDAKPSSILSDFRHELFNHPVINMKDRLLV